MDIVDQKFLEILKRNISKLKEKKESCSIDDMNKLINTGSRLKTHHDLLEAYIQLLEKEKNYVRETDDK